MQPTHQQKQFSANRLFTDRHDVKEVFIDAIESLQTRDEYRVINWYGVGGQGKTAIFEEFEKKILPAIQKEKKIDRYFSKIGWGAIDFENSIMRHLEEAMLSLRLQIASTIGGDFPAFDVAFARYFSLVNPGANMRTRHPELFRSDNEILGDVIDWSKEGIEATSAVASLFLPGANILYKYGHRLAGRIKEWWEKRGKTVLEDLDELSADQIRQKLPTYLGSDLFEILREQPEKRIVILLDTYEALWRDKAPNFGIAGLRVDDWVRKFIQESPGVLFVIFGRDRVRWEELDPVWAPVLNTYLLGLLSDGDAQNFLKAIPIENAAIRDRIVNGAKGLPFYLHLQVDLYENLLNEGKVPELKQFGGSHPQILARFIDHLSSAEQQLRLASYSTILNERIMLSLIDEFLGGMAQLDWNLFSSWSFISSGAGDRVKMHGIMRDELQKTDAKDRPVIFKNIHNFLFLLFDDLAKITREDEVTAEKDEYFAAAAEHLLLSQPKEFPDWLKKSWQIRIDTYRFDVLLKVLYLTLREDVDTSAWTVNDRIYIVSSFGNAYASSGRKKIALDHYRDALDLARKNRDSIEDEILIGAILQLCLSLVLSDMDLREKLLNEVLSLTAGKEDAFFEEIVSSEVALSMIAQQKGQAGRARTHLERAVTLLNSRQNEGDGSGSLEEIYRLENLGTIYIYLQKLPEAEKIIGLALEYADKLLGPIHAKTVGIANWYGSLILISGQLNNYQKTEEFAQKRIDQFVSIVGESHPRIVPYILLIANSYKGKNNDARASEYFQQASDILETTFGVNSLNFLECEALLLQSLTREGKFQTAVNRIDRLDLELLKQENTTQIVWVNLVSVLASIHMATGNTVEAQRIVTEAISVFEKFKIEHYDEYIDMIKFRSDIALHLQERDLAISDSLKVVTLREEQNHPLRIVLAAAFGHHAMVLNAFNEIEQAIEFNKKAFEILEKEYELDFSGLQLDVMQGLATGYEKLGLFSEAFRFHRQAFRYREKGNMGSTVNILLSYVNLIEAASRAGEFEEAEKISHKFHLEFAADINDDPIPKAIIMVSEAEAYLKMHNYELAATLAEEARQIFTDHPEYDLYYNRADRILFLALLEGGEMDRAKTIIFERIDRMNSQSFTGRGEEKIYSQLLLADYYRNTADPETCLKTCEKAVENARTLEASSTGMPPYCLWLAIFDLGKTQLYLGDLKVSHRILNDLLQQMIATPRCLPSWIASTRSFLSIICRFSGDATESERLAREALLSSNQAFSATTDSTLNEIRLPIFGTLATTLYDSGKVKEAIKFAKPVVNYIDKTPTQLMAWSSSYDSVDVIAKQRFKTGKKKDAYALLKRGEETIRTNGPRNSFALAMYLTSLSTLSFWDDNHPAARSYATEAAEILAARSGNKTPYYRTAQELLMKLGS